MHDPSHPSSDAHGDDFSPRGTLLFVLLMLLGYVLYWGYLLTASAAYLWLPVRRPASRVPVAPATNAS